ncbi:MAG: queuosine precursor transporter [Oscillospiraceae bacterium]
MEYGLITGAWSGIPNLLITAGLGLIVIIIGSILADRFGKAYAPFIMVGLMAGLQIMVSFTSSKFCTLTLGGQEFFIIAGSLMYPILACGEDYINEFYGKEIAKSSVTCQFIVRALSTAYLIWLIFLPCPASETENYVMFAKLTGIVPRVAIASMIATYIGGLLNVNIFAKIKNKTGASKLWLRTFVSTAVGLIVNAILFTLLAFVGTKTIPQMVQMVTISVGVRLATGVLELAFLYFMTFLKNKGVILKDAKEIVIVPACAQ